MRSLTRGEGENVSSAIQSTVYRGSRLQAWTLIVAVAATTVRDIRTRLAKRFPRMSEAQPRGGWAGAYDVSPDSYPILDRVGPEGLFVAVGFSGHGFKLSPEVGRLVAEYVATARRPELLESLRASRFGEGSPIRPDAPFPRRGRRLP